jgi:hypothetical protein
MNLVVNYRNKQTELLRSLASIAESNGNIRLRNAWLRQLERREAVK